MKNFFSNKLNVILSITLVVILATCATLAVALFGNPFSHEIIAKDFSGMSKTEVEQWVKENEVNGIYSYTYQYDDNIEKDKVVYQSVKADGVVKDSLTFIYSKGKEPVKEDTVEIKPVEEKLTEKPNETKEVTIPDNLLGLSEEDFKTKLKTLGFVLLNKSNTTYFAESIEKGKIYSYDDGTFNTSRTINYALCEGKYIFDANEYNGKKISDVERIASNYNNRNAKVNGKQLTVNFVSGDKNEAKAGTTYECSISSNKISCKTYVGISNKQTIPTDGRFLGKSEETFKEACQKLGFTKFKRGEIRYFSNLPENSLYSYDDGNLDINNEINYALSSGKYIFKADDFNGLSKDDVSAKVNDLKKRNAKVDGSLISVSFVNGDNNSDKTGKVYDCSLNKSTITCKVYTGTSASKKATIPANYLKLHENDFLSKVKALGFTNLAKVEPTYFSETIKEGCIWEYDDGTFDLSKTINYRLSAGKYSFNANEFNGISKEDATNKANSYKNRNADRGNLKIVFKNGEANTSNAGKTYGCSYSSSTITCNLYTGGSANQISVVSYIGKNVDEFKNWCSGNGINYSLSEQHSNDVSTGTLISQSPSSGNIDKGSTISAVISKGKEPVKNADVLSLSFITQNYKGDTFDETKNKVINYFNGSGFTNISIQEETSTKPLYSISSININGNNHTGSNSYPVNSNVVITIVSKNP